MTISSPGLFLEPNIRHYETNEKRQNCQKKINSNALTVLQFYGKMQLTRVSGQRRILIFGDLKRPNRFTAKNRGVL